MILPPQSVDDVIRDYLQGKPFVFFGSEIYEIVDENGTNAGEWFYLTDRYPDGTYNLGWVFSWNVVVSEPEDGYGFDTAVDDMILDEYSNVVIRHSLPELPEGYSFNSYYIPGLVSCYIPMSIMRQYFPFFPEHG